MSYHKFYCVTGLCDGCGEACWETEPAPHFANEREARETLAAQYEWRITRQITGRFEMLCGRCADREDCARYGHTWGHPELDHGSEQQARWDAEHREPLQMCRRCGTVRRDLGSAAGEQPDSPSQPLTAQEASAFAALYLATWPEDTAAAVNNDTRRGDDT